jgi:hypothetical protein
LGAREVAVESIYLEGSSVAKLSVLGKPVGSSTVAQNDEVLQRTRT